MLHVSQVNEKTLADLMVEVCKAISLGLAGVELMFFVAACIVLCLGFVTKTSAAEHRHSLLYFSHCPANKESEGSQIAGRGQNLDS